MDIFNRKHEGDTGLAAEALLIVAGLAILGGGLYLWNYAARQNQAADSVVSSAQNLLTGAHETPAQLAASLALAEARLAKQTALLSVMKGDFPSSPALDTQVMDEYTAAAAAIAKTDKFFVDPDSADPVLKEAAASPAAAAAISRLRAEVNADLAAWSDFAAGSGSTLVLSQQALADLYVMQSYVNQLETYYDSIPPSSDLQSDVIITDQADLADIASSVNDSINGVSSVGGPVVLADDNSTDGSGSGSSGDTGDSSGTGQGSSSASPDQSQPDTDQTQSSASSTDQTQVTVGDIQDQESAVQQTATVITQIQDQIQQSDTGSDSEASSSDSSGSSGDTSDSGSGSDDSGDQGQFWFQPPPPTQTGPQLIQGDNSF